MTGLVVAAVLVVMACVAFGWVRGWDAEWHYRRAWRHERLSDYHRARLTDIAARRGIRR